MGIEQLFLSSSLQLQDNARKREDNVHGPSGNRTDPELLGSSPGHQSPRKLAPKKFTRRRSLPLDSPGERDETSEDKIEYDDEDKDERDSLSSFILERRLSRRRRQEKRQRRRMRAGEGNKIIKLVRVFYK